MVHLLQILLALPVALGGALAVLAGSAGANALVTGAAARAWLDNALLGAAALFALAFGIGLLILALRLVFVKEPKPVFTPFGYRTSAAFAWLFVLLGAITLPFALLERDWGGGITVMGGAVIAFFFARLLWTLGSLAGPAEHEAHSARHARRGTGSSRRSRTSA